MVISVNLGGIIMVQSAVVENDSDAFSVRLLAFWVKGSITLDDAFLRVNMPNTVFFGLVPAGKQKDSSPLSGITNVYTSKSYKLSSIFLGLLIAIIGVALMGSSFFSALIAIIVGVLLIGSGIRTTFNYERSGISKTIDLPFFEAHHSEELEEKLTQKLATYQADRNVRAQTDRTIQQGAQNTQQIVNAVSGDANNAASSASAFCSSCGAPLAQGAKFCNKCGAQAN